MGSTCACSGGGLPQLELVYKDQRALFKHRPDTLEELTRSVLELAPEFKSPNEFVLEYVAADGVKSIFHDLSLQEAYIRHEHARLIIGVKPSLDGIRDRMRLTTVSP